MIKVVFNYLNELIYLMDIISFNTIEKPPIRFTADGLEMTPIEYSQLLYNLSKKSNISKDVYSLGGVVSELENRFAELLGKENAVIMPSGTLANHIAIRKLAGTKRRVIVQAESHIYNDSGDCLQTLSGLNLIPLSPNRANFTVEDVKKAISKTETGRVAAEVGVISIENPVRRKNNELFSFQEMRKISVFARDKGIKLHLDGARLFIASAFSRISPKNYSTLFDTVYISLFKYFNSASGAIIVCSNEFADNLYHLRRMFGGNIFQMWPSALIALDYIETFMEDFMKAKNIADEFIDLINKNDDFRAVKISNGTNIFRLYVSGIDLNIFRCNLKNKNIHISKPELEDKSFLLKINATLNRTSPKRLTQEFVECLNK